MAHRFLLHEARRPGVQQNEIKTIARESAWPTLVTTACRDVLGFLVWVPAGYASTHGIVLQTAVVIEACPALFRACG